VVAYAHGRYESVFGGLAPDIIKQSISHIELTNLHSAHGNHTYEDEGFHVWFQLSEFCKEPDGQKTDQGPEKDLEEGKDVPFGHDPVFECEGPGLGDLILQKQ
jgi:hypothetical protein